MVKVTAELAHRLVFDYEKTQCFVTVSERHGVDRRTVKAYVEQHKKHGSLQLERKGKRLNGCKAWLKWSPCFVHGCTDACCLRHSVAILIGPSASPSTHDFQHLATCFMFDIVDAA